jgi:hypothetical protein
MILTAFLFSAADGGRRHNTQSFGVSDLSRGGFFLSKPGPKHVVVFAFQTQNQS